MHAAAAKLFFARMEMLRVSGADQFIQRVPEHVSHTLIRNGYDTLRINNDDACLGRVENDPELLSSPFQFVKGTQQFAFRFFPFGNIGAESSNAKNFPVCIMYGKLQRYERKFSVRQTKGLFEL